MVTRPTGKAGMVHSGVKQLDFRSRPASTDSAAIGYELSEKEHRIFTTFSPGRLSSTTQVPQAAEPHHYDTQIKDLKDHITRLETQLKLSEARHLDMLKRMTFIKRPSPPRKSNNVSQTIGAEDSLLMSEKKTFQKASVAKQQ
jgi:hypothetical protein